MNYLLLILILLLTGCSDENASSHTNKTMIDPQFNALDKAKNVEQQLLDAAERLDKQIEK